MKRFAVVVALLVVLAVAWWATFGRDEVLFDRPGLFGRVVVVEGGGRRCLRFGGEGGLNQSCRSLANPARLELDYARAVIALTTTTPRPPSRALVIGLGGGSLPLALRQLHPGLHVVAVEIDPVVIDAARAHFDVTPDAQLELIAADGAEYLQRDTTPFDLVILDAFDDHGVAEPLFTRDALARIQSRLAPGGLFIANTFARAPRAAEEFDRAQSIFPALERVDVVRNRLYVAGPHAKPAITPALEAVGLTAEAISGWTISTRR
ncbi:MAG: fused MFS/spermidine synthase [Myxococcaceae bacterium]